MASDRPANDLDQSLLDRLNALKSTSVTLDTSSKLGPLNPASTTTNDTAQVKPSLAIGSTPSVSKDDALTERLRVLRNASSTSVPSSASRGSGQASTASPKPEPDTRMKGHDSSQPLPKRGQTPVSRNLNQESSQDEDTKTQIQTQILSSAWGLEEVDDQALDELLEGLQDDLNLQEDVPAEEEDEEDIDLHAIANNNNYDDDDGIIENDEHKVQKLLSELAPKPNNNSFADDHDDDDSDGEAMTKETNRVLNQVQDEINLSGRPTDDDNDDDPFSLPSPPSGTRTPTFTTTSPKQEPSLTLPTVPSSTLSSPASSGSCKQVTDDIPSLTARLSHLRSTPIKTDAFGLPSVPTTTLILPADDSSSSFLFPPPPPPASAKYQTKSTKRWVGRNESYTDEDARRWCKVCLEDATIRCEGCEDDGYCVRCWREMHVGPAAGWEERGTSVV
ncbi:hypothetical protein NEUTE1DRAFT_132532 [Neurospora tetrasperma FGSC 2508]|uniref:Uncharacterized protein n=1 Tax=Neurospora tetrasperma (strain FGSC 2508 / ATCC MYA-4615 / P0657) TaxID=510951 RepID=F8N2H2_NEUT8|nr:uncharacterized protein NEUTE1DRAFT_132532 [Neurospora tetrasperma FGSC 2508]EGO51644.1 hypothetical protein NEUTE1DRAFT_132532 [Neurospora tetrasperma FGSC 2508]